MTSRKNIQVHVGVEEEHMKFNTLSLSVMMMGTLAGAASLQAHASGYHFGTQSVSAQG